MCVWLSRICKSSEQQDYHTKQRQKHIDQRHYFIAWSTRNPAEPSRCVNYCAMCHGTSKSNTKTINCLRSSHGRYCKLQSVSKSNTALEATETCTADFVQGETKFENKLSIEWFLVKNKPKCHKTYPLIFEIHIIVKWWNHGPSFDLFKTLFR